VIKNRLPLDDPLFHEMEFIEPSVALDLQSRSRLPSLSLLKDNYNHLLDQNRDVGEEWRQLPVYFDEEEIRELRKKTNTDFWIFLTDVKDTDGEPVFKNLVCLVKLVLTLPHSNAETERIFSMLTDTKTKKRNKMGPELLNAVLVTKSSMVAKEEDCRNKKITPEHYSFHNMSMYAFKNV